MADPPDVKPFNLPITLPDTDKVMTPTDIKTESRSTVVASPPDVKPFAAMAPIKTESPEHSDRSNIYGGSSPPYVNPFDLPGAQWTHSPVKTEGSSRDGTRVGVESPPDVKPFAATTPIKTEIPQSTVNVYGRSSPPYVNPFDLPDARWTHSPIKTETQAGRRDGQRVRAESPPDVKPFAFHLENRESNSHLGIGTENPAMFKSPPLFRPLTPPTRIKTENPEAISQFAPDTKILPHVRRSLPILPNTSPTVQTKDNTPGPSRRQRRDDAPHDLKPNQPKPPVAPKIGPIRLGSTQRRYAPYNTVDHFRRLPPNALPYISRPEPRHYPRNDQYVEKEEDEATKAERAKYSERCKKLGLVEVKLSEMEAILGKPTYPITDFLISPPAPSKNSNATGKMTPSPTVIVKKEEKVNSNGMGKSIRPSRPKSPSMLLPDTADADGAAAMPNVSTTLLPNHDFSEKGEVLPPPNIKSEKY